MVSWNNDDFKILSDLQLKTGVKAKDVIMLENDIIFLVKPEDVKKFTPELNRAFKKKVVFLQDCETPIEMIKKWLGLDSIELKETGNTIMVKVDERKRGAVIGRGGWSISILNTVLKKKFGVLAKVV
ncbi:MAG: hypothetical protein M1594_01835 [Candidatus Marsarchaeota archaeon]|nr:hypothetical protein [Candidatus Marsarchaeota archaeon]